MRAPPTRTAAAVAVGSDAAALRGLPHGFDCRVDCDACARRAGRKSGRRRGTARAIRRALTRAATSAAALEAAEQAHALDQPIPGRATPGCARSPLSTRTPRASHCRIAGSGRPAGVVTEEDARDSTRRSAISASTSASIRWPPCYFGQVPAGTPSHPQAQAGLAILSVRRGHSRQALVYFVAARVVRQARSAARRARARNALPGRAARVRDGARPARCQCCGPRLRGARRTAPASSRRRCARARTSRHCAATRRRANGRCANCWRSTARARGRERARRHAARAEPPARCLRRRARPGTGAARGRRRDCRRSNATGCRISTRRSAAAGATARPSTIGSKCRSCSSPGPAAIRAWAASAIAGRCAIPDSDRVPAGEPFGSSPPCPPLSDPQSDEGVGAARCNGRRPTASCWNSAHADVVRRQQPDRRAALPRRDAEGPWSFGLERTAVADSLLSYGGTIDPLTGAELGRRDAQSRLFRRRVSATMTSAVSARCAGAVLDGQRVDGNSQWEAEAGFLEARGVRGPLERALRRQCEGLGL